MAIAESKVIAIIRLSEKGQLTIPADYRRAHDLGRDSTLVLLEIGDALVVVPHDDALAAIAARLEAALRGSNETVETLIAAAGDARRKILSDEFGEEGAGK
jgi:bifunctional DNA-binding transcriptional regulator/antitoxin component of YhaV-PrlF toxin-antitoxin module